MKLITIIRSLIFNVFLIVWTVVISSLFAPSALLKDNKIISYLGLTWSWVVIKALRYICGIKIQLRGNKKHLAKTCIVACKHQSAIDTIFLLAHMKNAVYVIKKELLNIPFYGWFLAKMGMIPIKRSGGFSSLKKMLQNSEYAITKKKSIIIFPEGTRVKPYESVEYNPGIYALYKRFSSLDTVPIATNSGFFWGKNSWLKNPGEVIFEILDPMPKRLDKEEFMEKIKRSIDMSSNNL